MRNILPHSFELPNNSYEFISQIFTQLQHIANIGVWIVEKNGNFETSQELKRIFAIPYKKDKPTFEEYMAQVYSEDRTNVRKTIEDSITRQKAFQLDKRILCPDGTIRYLRTWGHPMPDNEGVANRYIGVCQDITNQILVEKQLHYSEERFRNIVNYAQDGIWILDSTGKTTLTNKRMAEILGYSIAELTKMDWRTFIEESHWPLLSELIFGNPKREANIKFRLRKKDYSTIWTIFNANALYDDKMNFIGTMVVFTDQTQQIQREVLLSAQRDIFDLLISGGNVKQALTVLIHAIEKILDGVIGSVLLLDKEGKHVLTGAAPNLPEAYNSAVHGLAIGPCAGSCGTAAYTRQLIISENIEIDPLWSRYKNIALQFDLRACWSNPILGHDGEVLGTFAMYFKEPRRPTEMEIALVQEATGAAALAISHVKYQDSALQFLKKQKKISARENKLVLEEQRSIKLREDFIFLASHELRTPLTPLTMEIDLARRMLEDKNLPSHEKIEELKSLMQGAERQIKILTQLSEDLLNVTWINAKRLILDRKKVYLAKVVKEINEKMTDDFINANCARTLIIHQDSLGEWDEQQLERVFSHLLANAIKFGAGQAIEMEVDQKDEKAIFRIRDNGIGIAKKDQKKLFKRFARTSPISKYPGLGLGLFIAKAIVKAHGGTIEVDSEFGKGATFTVFLPF